MKKAVIFFLFALLFVMPAKAEVLFGDLVLELADENEVAETMSTILSISYLDSLDDLKIGDIYMIDIVDSNCLVAVTYDDYTQVWVWSIEGEFLYGFEMLQTYHPIGATNRSFCLSPDGTVLIYLGRGGSIIGLNAYEENPLVTVFATPTVVEKLNYKYPSRSPYKRYYREKGKVIVTSPQGEKIVVFDFSDEYIKYKAEYEAKILPYKIAIYIFYALFISCIIWLIKNNIKKPPSPLCE